MGFSVKLSRSIILGVAEFRDTGPLSLVQGLACGERTSKGRTDWIPAYAGMTEVAGNDGNLRLRKCKPQAAPILGEPRPFHAVRCYNCSVPRAQNHFETTCPRKTDRRMVIAWRVFRTVSIVYLGVLLLMLMFERALIFFPTKYPDGQWQPPNLVFEDAYFTARDGTKLHGWHMPHPAPRAHILFAHGNAGNLSHRADEVRLLHDRLAVSVLIFDYRGYGRSEGSPDEAGILQDARAARAWLAERAGVAESDIVLLGRSIGGAVAVDLAAEDGAAGLILQSTFTSLPETASVHYPWLPAKLLMRTRLESINKIGRYDGPLLASHGNADTIVPYRLGRQLFEAAVNSHDKKFLTIEGGDHNDPQPLWYYDEVDQFLGRIGRREGS